MAERYFVTGDALTGGYFTALLRFPTSQANWVYSVFLGALDDMSDPNSWITGGETTPDEAAELFESIFFGVAFNVINVGMINFFAAAPSTNWLLCDGSTVNQSDYPDLYAGIGTTFNTGGEPAGTFRLPDLRGRIIAMTNNGSGRLPAFANTLGGTGGESDHTLTSGEMPSHNHGLNTFDGLALAPGELPVKVPTLIPTDATANAGGGGSHNNVQPTMALAGYILALI